MMILCIIVTSTSVDVPDPNPLELTFGYTNICLYFDYDPPRIIAAMIYPIVEYSMVLYVATNWYVAKEAFKRRGEVTYTIFTIATVIEIVLIAWFRLVFVIRAFTNITGHTVPFMGLQITLSMIELQNRIYYDILYDPKSFAFYPNNSYLRILGWIYTILLICVTIFKIIITSAVLYHHPLMTIGTPTQMAVGKFFDWTWMLLAAICPLLISIYLLMYCKHRPKIVTSLTMNLSTSSSIIENHTKSTRSNKSIADISTAGILTATTTDV
jgi:hypothetical protein